MKKFTILLLISALLSLSACSLFVDVEEVKKEANLAIEEKDFETFNTLYLKLEKADSAEAKAYIEEVIKENPFESYTEEILTTVKSNVPVLEDFITSRLHELHYKREVNLISHDLKRDVGNVKDPLHDINSYIILINNTEDMMSLVDTVEGFVSKANNAVTTLEDLETPEQFQDIHDNLIESTKEYRDTLQSKYVFLKENQAGITSSNSLLTEGNWFAMSNSTDYSSEMDRINAELQFSVQNLEQRLDTVSSKIKE